MAWTTKDARLKLTPEEEAKTVGMDHYELIAYMHALEQDGTRAQGALIVPDAVNKSVFHELTPVEETQAPAQPTIKIGDMSFTGTEQEIELQLKAYFESQQRQPAVADPPPARDPNTGRFAKQEPQQNVSAVDKVLNDQVAKAIEEKTGVSLEEVKQLVEERRGQQHAQSWAEATTAFLQTEIGRQWPGGAENQKRLGKLIEDSVLPDGTPFADAPNKVAAMTACFEWLRENDRLVPNPEAEARQRKADADAKATADLDEWNQAVAKATTREEIDDLTGRTARAQAALRPGSGQFGTK